MRPRHLFVPVLAAAIAGSAAAPAAACAGLVTPGGRVKLLRTATLAAYANGVEHYVTSFRFEGGGAEFGSIVPLPGIPSKVEKGGEWTLQRLDLEVRPPRPTAAPAAGAPRTAARPARVVYETRIDALDLTVLEGGGAAVGRWAKERGFGLTPDAPEVLDFYGERSPYFLAARFDAEAAREQDQQVGEGTPIHLTIPTRNPWVPLRILGLGRGRAEVVDADVFLLTERRPALLPVRAPGITLARREPARTQLLDDLRSDKGMGWLPRSMWLTHIVVGAKAGDLRFDLAVDASGRGRPSWTAAGLASPAPALPPAPATKPSPAAAPDVPPTADPVAPEPAPVPSVALAAVPRSGAGRATGPYLLAGLLVGTVAGATWWSARRRPA